MNDDERLQAAVVELRMRFPLLMAIVDRCDRIIDLHRLAVEFPFGESFWASVWMDSAASALLSALFGLQVAAWTSFAVFVFTSWLLRRQLAATFFPPPPMSDAEIQAQLQLLNRIKPPPSEPPAS